MNRTGVSPRTARQLPALVGLGLALFGMPAVAAISWTFTGCSGISAAGATCAKSSGGITATAQAWSNTKDNGTNYKHSMDVAYLRQYSGGLGVTNKDGISATSHADCTAGKKDCAEADGAVPEHAVDNNQRYDSILFSFSDAIKLAQVVIGWPTSTPPNDSDITVLAYQGSGAPSLAGQTFTQMISAGWKLAGNYANVANMTNNTANVNGTNGYVSQYWLLAAYNPAFESSASGWTTGDDAVKFLTLAGDRPSRVPEPHALLLMATAAMAGFWTHRTRRRPKT